MEDEKPLEWYQMKNYKVVVDTKDAEDAEDVTDDEYGSENDGANNESDD
jgi:hypothetical protein